MNQMSIANVIDSVRGVGLVLGLVWTGLAIVTVTLLVLMRTQWGRSKPLRKCVALSVLAHVLFALYATTIEIVTSGGAAGHVMTFHISRLIPSRPTPHAGESLAQTTVTQPWDRIAVEATATTPIAPPSPLEVTEVPVSETSAPPVELPELPIDPRQTTEVATAAPPPENSAPGMADAPSPAEKLAAPAAESRDPPKLALDAPKPQPLEPEQSAQPTDAPSAPPGLPANLLDAASLLSRSPTSGAEASSVPAPESEHAPTPAPAPLVSVPGLAVSRDAAGQVLDTSVGDIVDSSATLGRLYPLPGESLVDGAPASPSATAPDIADLGAAASDMVPLLPAAPRLNSGPHATPELYRLRSAPNRERVVEAGGGSAETESAVHAALRWLAANQSADGRWMARQHGAGVELQILGQDRGGAGAQADNGLTGLALLAFLGAGHTQQEGEFRETVGRGIDYLIATQNANGHLGGRALHSEVMYCHGMATLALSEAFAMTGDPRLATPVRRAIGYTLAAQHRSTGGWRYRPGDTGDTSQLGWQLMALKSAQMAGVDVPETTRAGMMRFLKSVSFGAYGGLASYRPGERASRTMTAEALACRQFLGIDGDRRASEEAAEYILTELPGGAQTNVYYWYYATLAMYQLGGEPWNQWNRAMTRALVDHQRKDGVNAGSWDTSDLWGGYGGRVYTTSLGVLCLEVYYRFLPMHVAAGVRDTRLK